MTLTPSAILEPPTFIKEVYVDPNVSVSTSTNSVAPKKLLSFGHVASFLFDFTLAITIGTGTVASVPAQNAISSLTIRDVNNKEILKCNGNQLSRMRKLLTYSPSLGNEQYRKGEYDAGSNITSTGGNYRVELPLHVPVELQPITYEYTLGVLSDFLSTVGTATATATTRIYTKSYVNALNAEQAALARVTRYQTYTFPSISAEESYQQRLMENSLVKAVAIDVTSDSNLADVTWKAGGQVGFDKLTERNIQMIENRESDDGHTPTGFYVLPVPPTVVTNQTEFRINPAGSVAPVMYLGYSLPGEK